MSLAEFARRAALGLAAAIALSVGAAAQSYPAQPVKLMVPYPAGGTTDLLARAIGERLAQAWGQQIVVENRGGAGGAIGTESVARAAPDGLTIVLGNNQTHGANQALFPKLPYNVLRDFDAITLVATTPHVVVAPASAPYRSLADLIAAAKAAPGKLTYASSSVGSASHLIGELMELRLGLDMVHVPYRGAAPAVADLAAGRVDFMVATQGSVLGQIQGGALRALAVSTDARQPALPDAQTFGEAGFAEAGLSAWFGFFAPKGTPQPVIAQWADGVAAAIADPQTRERLEKAGFALAVQPPAAFQAFVAADLARWAEVVARAGVKVE